MSNGATSRRRGRFVVLGWFMIAFAACGPAISIGPATTAEVATEPAPEPSVTTEPPTDTPEATTETPTETATQAAAAGATTQCTVTARSLRVRGGPGTNFPILGAVTAGQIVTASGRNEPGDWATVKTPDGAEGWASVDFLNCTPGADTLPVATPAP